MSKELEALKVWNAVKKCLNLYHHQVVKEDIDVKTVEGMSIDIIEKSLKALEIIKGKTIDLEYLKCCDTYKQYRIICSYWNAITEEEFDLLKEVLLN